MYLKQTPIDRQKCARGAKAERFAYQATQIVKESVSDLPKQLEKLKKELEAEKSSQYPNTKRIARFNQTIENLQNIIKRCQDNAK